LHLNLKKPSNLKNYQSRQAQL